MKRPLPHILATANMLLYNSLALFLSAALLPSTTFAAAAAKARPASTTTSSESTTSPTSTPSPPPQPCTIRSPHSGAFFDLNKLNIPAPLSLPETKRAKARDYSWNATGWDMGYNFTMNFCGGVVEDLDQLGGVVGVDREMWWLSEKWF